MKKVSITLLCVLSLASSLFSMSQYDSLKLFISSEKEKRRIAYIHDKSKQDSIIKDSRDFLTHVLELHIFPTWYGTQWDFNGTTRIPREGSIACGYFVTNILADLGFKIPRIRWAQSASEVFIKKLAPQTITRFVNKDISVIEKHLQKNGNGLYLVGLDCHVGFILYKDNKGWFIHSNYYNPEEGVVREPIRGNNPLNDSNYRVIGKLFSSEMMRYWLFRINY